MAYSTERKKLLKQFAELERDSVNYFDVKREFFLIDSVNLYETQTRLYGYSIQASGIYEDDNLTPDAVKNLDGRGCYVYVEARGGKITIRQDLNGSWGIYLFRHGDYFALSNSFFRLLDHIKFRYPLTVNRDDCRYLLINGVCSHAYSETAVNEIQLIDRNAVIHIDTAKRNLQLELINYREHTVSLDSAAGIATLDRWLDFWSGVLRGIAQHTNFITADLSGGFDSRISFVTLLNSGIDCNKIQINSDNDTLHTHAEDYAIASKIANHYGFKLNQPLPDGEFLNLSLPDVFNFNVYGNQLFSNVFRCWLRKSVNKIYHMSGAAGETIRSYWYGPLKNFAGNEIYRGLYSFSPAVGYEVSNSVKTILESAVGNVCRKYGIKTLESLYIPQYLYQETRCRHHFGKRTMCYYFTNSLQISPALDPELRTLQLNLPECRDLNLLMALIFVRYAPDLLKFPVQGNRSIAPETIAYAQKLNERFPRRTTIDKIDGGRFNLSPRDLRTEKILASGHNNPTLSEDMFDTYLKALFESARTYGLFNMYFDKELYNYALAYHDTHVFEGLRPLYAVTGIAKVLEDAESSQRIRPLYRDLKRFLESGSVTLPMR